MNPIVMAAFTDELAYINGFEKDAGLGSMISGAAKGVGKMFKPKIKPPSGFKPSFKGHNKALNLGTTSNRGVVTKRTMQPGGLQQKKFVTGVEGWN